ncbi:MAG: glycosyl hydrolase [Gemmatimonadetes bacterium]|nr:glycosyl hydrolase [Gemmatimonadota bacterium]
MARSNRPLGSIAFRASCAAIVLSSLASAQSPRPARPVTTIPAALSGPVDTAALGALRWRELGPFRGGRSVAAAGSVKRPSEYYFGSTGGGVFKSVDGGNAWFPVTDKYFGGTIGAIAVAPSNPDVVYVGGGEYAMRGNVAHGDGMWKTTDGGKTWSYIGLADARQISNVVVNPTNPDIVYVGALGHVWAPNSTRGVFRSKDGGKNWQKVLFRNDSTGVINLVMDPNNPDVLYAAFWQAGRTPWMLVSGGAASGIFKTTDGGETWTDITRNPGMPKAGLIGNIGIDVSPVNSNIVFALIEHDSGGVYRSSDAGKTWSRINTDRNLRQRAWYYTRIHADPKDSNVVYVNNVSFMKSTDGGRNFRRQNAPHGDSHGLWIAPDNSNRMIETNDGGANVTTDGGRNWTDQDFATAQFYHVITTTHFPYQVCGAQQDNSTLCGPSRNQGGIDIADWKDAGGGESGYIASRADDPDIIYAGSYGALITRKDMRNGIERNVNPWPDNPMGHPASDLTYRWQWTFPIMISPHNPNVVYAMSNHVHKTTNGGESWTVISPDLTRNDPRTLGNSGGPITKDQTSVEYYGTVFAFAESPVKAGVLWAGSDDGLVHVSRDAGRTWTKVTPPDMGEWTRVSIIEPSHFDAGTAYLAGNRYQLDDYKPYLWKTADYGKSWTRIDAGIPETEFARAIREDPMKRGLLFAGTERGVWFSPNDGKSWQSLRLNMPLVPVHDLAIKEGDLIAATHGRAFWVVDNISTLEQAGGDALTHEAFLFKPRDQYRTQFGGGFARNAPADPSQVPAHPVGQNPPDPAIVQYWLKDANQKVTLDFLDAKGRLIKSFTSAQDSTTAADSLRRDRIRRQREDSLKAAGLSADSIAKLLRTAGTGEAGGAPQFFGGGGAPPRVPNKAGMNSFTWNMRSADAEGFQGMIMWIAGLTGPTVPPGSYSVRMAMNGRPMGSQEFKLLRDPRMKGVTQADLDEQYRFLNVIRDRTTDAHRAVKTIRYVKRELEARKKEMPADFAPRVDAFTAALSTVEDSLYQTKNRAGQDPLNYPIRLDNKIGHLAVVVGSSEGRPTAQSYQVLKLLSAQLDRELARLKQVMDATLPALNASLKAAGKVEVVPRADDAPAPAPAGR